MLDPGQSISFLTSSAFLAMWASHHLPVLQEELNEERGGIEMSLGVIQGRNYDRMLCGHAGCESAVALLEHSCSLQGPLFFRNIQIHCTVGTNQALPSSWLWWRWRKLSGT